MGWLGYLFHKLQTIYGRDPVLSTLRPGSTIRPLAASILG